MDGLGLRADVGALIHDRPLGVGHGLSFGVHVSAQQMLILRSRWRNTGIASGKWTWQALLHALPALLTVPVSVTLRAPWTVPVTAATSPEPNVIANKILRFMTPQFRRSTNDQRSSRSPD